MAALTIRNIDEAIKQSLRIRAAKHGVSMEEEARRILRHALQQASSQQSLGQRLKQRFAEVADADFELPSRQVSRTRAISLWLHVIHPTSRALMACSSSTRGCLRR